MSHDEQQEAIVLLTEAAPDAVHLTRSGDQAVIVVDSPQPRNVLPAAMSARRVRMRDALQAEGSEDLAWLDAVTESRIDKAPLPADLFDTR